MNKGTQRSIKNSILAISLLLSLVIFGTLGYMSIEHYRFLDALYMTMITIATVGFEEVRTLSDPGIVFTIVLISISIGIYGIVLTTITKHILDGAFTNYYKNSRVKRKIKNLENHVVICGYGRVGKQVAHELITHNEEVIIIDANEERIECIKENPNLLYIQGDATADEVLELAQIKKAKSLITTLPKDADNLFVVLSAREVCPTVKIISRATEEHSDIKLKRAGATNVIMPNKIGGKRMAKLVAQPDIVEFLENILTQEANEVNIEEIDCNILHNNLLERAIRDIGIRNKSGANIIGLKREDNTYMFNPSPNTIIKSTHKLFVLGTSTQVEAFKNLLETGM